MLCVPVRDNRRNVIAVLQAVNQLEGFFSAQDQQLMEFLAFLAGHTLQNSLMYEVRLGKTPETADKTALLWSLIDTSICHDLLSSLRNRFPFSMYSHSSPS